MKRIVISDGGNLHETSKICKKYNLGVTVASFAEPDNFENVTNIINDILKAYNNVDIISIHGPMHDLNFGSKDCLIREVTAKRYNLAYDVSKLLKCKNIIVHNGYVPGTSFPANWAKRAKAFWDSFLLDKDNDIIFFIENLLEHDPEIIIDVINSVNNNCLKMCFDIGHANVFSKIKIIDWIKEVNKNIGYVHMHNNYGEKDEHNGLNNGNINIKEICEALEQYCPDAIWDLETGEYEKSIEWLIDNKYIK